MEFIAITGTLSLFIVSLWNGTSFCTVTAGHHRTLHCNLEVV